MAVERGKAGISWKGIGEASVRESAKLPRPEPRTRPMRGRSGLRCSRYCAAVSAEVNWSVIGIAGYCGAKALSILIAYAALKRRSSTVVLAEIDCDGETSVAKASNPG